MVIIRLRQRCCPLLAVALFLPCAAACGEEPVDEFKALEELPAEETLELSLDLTLSGRRHRRNALLWKWGIIPLGTI